MGIVGRREEQSDWRVWTRKLVHVGISGLLVLIPGDYVCSVLRSTIIEGYISWSNASLHLLSSSLPKSELRKTCVSINIERNKVPKIRVVRGSHASTCSDTDEPLRIKTNSSPKLSVVRCTETSDLPMKERRLLPGLQTKEIIHKVPTNGSGKITGVASRVIT